MNDDTPIETSEADARPWRGEVPAAEPSAMAVQPPADPMDWPLPCDVTVGHGTMRKGVRLGTLVTRMKVLYEMATGEDADRVANRTPEERAALLADFRRTLAASQPATAPVVPAGPVAPMCGGRDYCGRFPFCGCGRPDDLPERDQTKTNQQQGLYRKFEVRRTDGSDKPGGKHYGCEYFVLDTSHDPHAKAALAAYASAVQSTHPELASDLRQRYDLAAAPAAPVLQPAAQQGEADDRAAFEAWCSDGGKWLAAVERSGAGYKLAKTQSDWTAWQAARAAPPARQAVALTEEQIAEAVRAVAELPDRTSPDDWPEAMLVTADELTSILVGITPAGGEAAR